MCNLWIELWICITSNMRVMKILYAIPCETCLISEEYLAAREGIVTLIRTKLKRTCTTGEFAPVAIGAGTVTVHGESTTLLCTSHV
jgi:hypothetical protein